MKLCSSCNYSYTIFHLNLSQGVALHHIGWFFIISVRFDNGFFLLNRMHWSYPQENESIPCFQGTNNKYISISVLNSQNIISKKQQSKSGSLRNAVVNDANIRDCCQVKQKASFLLDTIWTNQPLLQTDFFPISVWAELLCD